MEVKESYYLSDILEKYGWTALINNLQFCLNKAQSKDSSEDYFLIDSFENFI